MPEQYSLPEIVEIITRVLGELQFEARADPEFARLSLRQISCLELVARLADPTPSDLARVLAVTKPTISDLVGRLVQAGYVKKERSAQDARSFHLQLTDKGCAMMAAHNRLHERLTAGLVRGLDDDERQQLVILLNKVVATLVS